jgi:hypothetical protein
MNLQERNQKNIVKKSVLKCGVVRFLGNRSIRYITDINNFWFSEKDVKGIFGVETLPDTYKQISFSTIFGSYMNAFLKKPNTTEAIEISYTTEHEPDEFYLCIHSDTYDDQEEKPVGESWKEFFENVLT